MDSADDPIETPLGGPPDLIVAPEVKDAETVPDDSRRHEGERKREARRRVQPRLPPAAHSEKPTHVEEGRRELGDGEPRVGLGGGGGG